MRQPRNGIPTTWQIVLLVVVLTLGALWASWDSLKWQAYDDEGSYLYASWRISLGELPYRDFLTPQLPVFLYPGAAVLGLTGLSVLAARLYMLALSLGAVVLLFLTLRRMGHPLAAWSALPLLLVHHDLFWAARFYRPEAPMLLWSALGVYLFTRGYSTQGCSTPGPSIRQRKMLMLAGCAFGLSMMSKLFGALPMAGIGLFVLVEAWRTGKWRERLIDLLYLAIPFALVVLAIGGLFSALAPNFVAAVLGHHVRQGSGTPLPQVVLKALNLFRAEIVSQPMYTLLVIAGIALGLRSERWDVRLFACQLPTALSFFMITRDLQLRHLTYLAPACAALAALAVEWAWERLASRPRWPRPVGAIGLAALVILALWPHALENMVAITWADSSTANWVRFLQEHTGPQDVVISDYPGLNFFARRRSTRTAAGLSAGAAESGQILGADLIREIEESNAKIITYNVAHGGHQIIRLRDYAVFKQYVQTNFHLYDRLHYDGRLMEVYSRNDVWEGRIEDINFDNQLKLTGVDWLKNRAEPGMSLQVRLRWQCTAPMSQDYGVTLRLLDQQGHLWGLGHKTLEDIAEETYLDERGLEQLVIIPTSRWPTQESTVQVFELPVDPATPPGSYTVELRVHPKGTWDSLNVLDATGAPIGHDWEAGNAEVLSARGAPDPSALGMDKQLDIDMVRAVRLLGHDTPPATIRPGDTFSVSLYWQKTERTRQDYQMQLSLRSAGRVWARSVTSLARSDYPVPYWYVGQVLRGQHDILVDAETPTGDYELFVQLLDAQGLPAAQAFSMGSIRVEGRQRVYQPPAMATSVNADMGGLISLLGYDIASFTVSYRDALSLTLYWRAEERTTTSYKAFVHVIDEADKVWAQQDSEPVNGSYPTTAWLPGEIIADTYTIPIGEGPAAGSYWIEVGLYDPATGTRLAVTSAHGQRQAYDRVLLQRIYVVE